jgi:hypothetical protein
MENSLDEEGKEDGLNIKQEMEEIDKRLKELEELNKRDYKVDERFLEAYQPYFAKLDHVIVTSERKDYCNDEDVPHYYPKTGIWFN